MEKDVDKIKMIAEKHGLVEKDDSQYIQVDLPSNGKVYKEGVCVKLRTMKVKDERVIADMTSANFEVKMQQLFRQVMKGIEVKEMTVGDRTYCLLWLRINSYTKDYKVLDIICPTCSSSVSYNFDLSKLNVIDLKDFSEPHSVELNGLGKTVDVKLARIGDEVSIMNYSKMTKMSEYVVRYASTLCGDEFKTLGEKVQFCLELDVKDYAKIKQVNDYIGYHGVEYKTSFVCPQCGGGGDIELPFRPELFIPRSESIDAFEKKI